MKRKIRLSVWCGLLFSLVFLGLGYMGHTITTRMLIDMVGAKQVAALPYININWIAMALYYFVISTILSFAFLLGVEL